MKAPSSSRTALPQLGITEAPRTAFRPDPDTLQIFFREKSYAIDVPTGKVIVDQVRPRPVLFELNQMHLNATQGVWTLIADGHVRPARQIRHHRSRRDARDRRRAGALGYWLHNVYRL